MIKVFQKLTSLAKQRNSKKKTIKSRLTLMGTIDKELFEYTKEFYSIQNLLIYLKNLQVQLSSLKEFEGKEVNSELIDKYPLVFDIFKKDRSYSIIDNNKLNGNIVLETLLYEDDLGKNMKFKDIDKNMAKYKNPLIFSN
jgi:hypothetical protein